MTQSFFNPNHGGLLALSRYGMVGGVQLPWTIGLIIYHASISILIPILMVELLWPDYKFTPLLKKKSILFTTVAVMIVTIVIMNNVWSLQNQEDVPYVPSALLLFGSCCVIGMLIWFAYHFRTNRMSTQKIKIFSPLVFGIIGFLIQIGNLFPVSILAENQVPASITILLQLGFIGMVLLFIRYQFFHVERTQHHVVALIVGSILF